MSTTANSVLVTVHAANPGNALKWSGAASGTWDIVTSVNWYNTTIPGPDTFHRDDSVTFGDTYVGATPPANTAVTLNAVVAPPSVTFNDSVLNYSLGGTGGIAGATSLVKSGAGTLTITMTNSANNSYSGGTVINGGILSISDDNNVGADAGRITINKLPACRKRFSRQRPPSGSQSSGRLRSAPAAVRSRPRLAPHLPLT